MLIHPHIVYINGWTIAQALISLHIRLPFDFFTHQVALWFIYTSGCRLMSLHIRLPFDVVHIRLPFDVVTHQVALWFLYTSGCPLMSLHIRLPSDLFTHKVALWCRYTLRCPLMSLHVTLSFWCRYTLRCPLMSLHVTLSFDVVTRYVVRWCRYTLRCPLMSLHVTLSFDVVTRCSLGVCTMQQEEMMCTRGWSISPFVKRHKHLEWSLSTYSGINGWIDGWNNDQSLHSKHREINVGIDGWHVRWMGWKVTLVSCSHYYIAYIS